MKLFVSVALSVICVPPAHAVTMDFASVGNAGNVADSTGYGAVSYNYAISKTEVTNTQYVEFLNNVSASDPYDLYSINMASDTYGGITRSGSPGNYSYAVKADDGGYTYANKPVVYVSWFDSVRFTNWLHNGQGTADALSGDTETGAYTLLGGTGEPSSGLSVTRNPDAEFWLPSEDEWYKAAYHDASAGTAGTYFDYATGTDNEPDNNLPSSDSGNSANHYSRGYTTDIGCCPYTDVGAYGLSESPYGTYDQNGNVFEWHEGFVHPTLPIRGLRGGSWLSNTLLLMKFHRNYGHFPTAEYTNIGFRVATVPEPSSLLLLVSLSGVMIVWQRV